MYRAPVCLGVALLFCSFAAAQQTIRIGQAVVALTGPWKFHVGDNPRWADPDFDDSGWEDVDLTPKGATDYMSGMSEFVPGWTTKRHPGYAGYAWYRLKLRIEESATPLSLLMPLQVDDGYEIYANGREVGHFGDFTGRKPVIYYTTAEWFSLPAAALGKSTQLAIRFYMLPQTAIMQPDSGGMHGPPRIGAAGVIGAFGDLARQRFERTYFSNLPECAVYLGFAFALLALYWLDRSERAYLWFACAYAALALQRSFILTATIPGIPGETVNLGTLLSACWMAFLMSAWWQWFELRQKRWLVRLVWVAVSIWMLAYLCALSPLLGSVVPLSWLGGLHITVNIARLGIGLLFAVIVVFGIRRQGREGWLALPAALLFAVSLFTRELLRLHVRQSWAVAGLHIDIGQITTIALSAALGILIIRRFQRSQWRKQQLEADLRQAQQVQQLLLPQAIPEMPGFQIQCEYRPAQEVGGDFFQVLETREGGVLVVIGDVSGKGVRAAMLVALIVGALRSFAEDSQDPQTILRRLNRRLCGRMEGGFATCLCARIPPDGLLTVANAGHLAPWLDSCEIEVPHDLPLGIAEGIEYAASHLKLPENGTLTFVSDGVVEAKNGHKELFGFERARAISTHSAAQIAEAAKQFGQEDDITVVTIQRVPVPAYA